MWNKTRKLVAIFAVTLALLSIPAAASDNRTNVETTTQTTSASTTVGDTVVDLRLLMLDRDLYPSTYEDHAYMCSDGNCTDW
jgi:hypothetical protein